MLATSGDTKVRMLKDDGIPQNRIPEFRKYLGQVTSETARVGRIEFVNCFPLYCHFEEELAGLGYSAEIVEGFA